MKTIVPSLALAAAMSFGLAANGLAAQDNSGYLTDSRGNVVKDAYGDCWRTGYWTPALANAECDPELVPKPKPSPPAAAKPPMPRAEAPKPAPVKVSLSADELFGFDQAVIQPGQRAALDAFLATLTADNVQSITVTGHTDRIGSDTYNMELSLARANAVKAEMVKHGIPENRIRTEGKGARDPVTRPDQCPGAKSPAVIKCLQPDRRVDVEVVGTRRN